MARKSRVFAGGGALLLVIAIAGFLGLRWATRQAPDFYRRALARPQQAPARQSAAKEFAQRTAHLVRELQYSDQWEEEFSQSRVNAWLAHELQRQYGDVIPPGVTDPRIQFDDGLVSFACQVDNERFSGVISVALRPKVVGPNRMTITVESLAAGLLPLKASSFTDDVSAYLARFGVLHWWRHVEGRPVLHVRILPDQLAHPVVEEIEVDDRRLRIAGQREKTPTLTMR